MQCRQHFTITVGRISVVIAAVMMATLLIGGNAGRAAESIQTPGPSIESAGDVYPLSNHVHFFPAVLTGPRRFGPVEEPEVEFFAPQSSDEPGFPVQPTWSSWGFGGWGFGGWGWRGGWGYGWGRGWGWPGVGWRGFPGYAIGPVGYNRYASPGWNSSPYRQTYSSRYLWYTPGGIGPNIYQPWYQWRYTAPWYAPNGNGPNIYSPDWQLNRQVPWYSPLSPGPNIYNPAGPSGTNGLFFW